MDVLRRRVRQCRWPITGCLAAGILLLSLLPEPPRIDIGVSYGDKIGHFVAYLVLGFMLLLSIAWGKPQTGPSAGGDAASSLRARPAIPRFAAAASAVVVAACYGGAIEVLQYFTGRDAEILDVVADLAGAMAGSILCLLSVLRPRPDRRPPES